VAAAHVFRKSATAARGIAFARFSTHKGRESTSRC
jgi:hypothetical protein